MAVVLWFEQHGCPLVFCRGWLQRLLAVCPAAEEVLLRLLPAGEGDATESGLLNAMQALNDVFGLAASRARQRQVYKKFCGGALARLAVEKSIPFFWEGWSWDSIQDSPFKHEPAHPFRLEAAKVLLRFQLNLSC